MNNSCQLIDKKIEMKITESLKKTKDDKREHGFNLCLINGKVTTTDIEKGEEHRVEIKTKCPINSKNIASFHTHTRLPLNKDVVPSVGDTTESMVKKVDFFCIGANKDSSKILRCFDRKDLETEINSILDLMDFPINKENIRKSSRLMIRNMIKEKEYLEKHSCQRLF